MNFNTPEQEVNTQNIHTHRAQIRHIKHSLTTNEKGRDPIIINMAIYIQIEKAAVYTV